METAHFNWGYPRGGLVLDAAGNLYGTTYFLALGSALRVRCSR